MRNVLQLVRIAIRNVLRNRRRSAITLVAIGMAVAVLVFVRGTLNGLQASLKNRVIYGQTGVLQVHKKGFTANVKKSPLQFGFAVDEGLLAKIRAIEGVTFLTPRITLPTMVNVNDTTLFSLAFGIDPVSEYQVCPQRKRDLGEGAAPHMKDDAGFGVVSPELRRQLSVSLEEELTLVAPDFDGTLNAALVKVGGFLADAPAFSGDKKLLFVPLGVAQSLSRLDGQATELAVSSADPDHADALKARLEAVLGDTFEVHTWRELAKFVVDALNNQEAALGFVIGVFALIAIFGILNTMLMIVLARTREIGTMMAVGVRRRAILWLVVSEALVLGLIGALFGGVIGTALVVIFGDVGISLRVPGANLPEIVRPFITAIFVVKTVGYAAFGAALASVYPAYRASKLTPVEALSSL